MPWTAAVGGLVSAVAGHFLNSSSGSGNGGGTSGGSAPQVYQPTNQAGMYANFNTEYSNYMNSVNANQALTSPYATSLFNSQMSNPYNSGLMQGAENSANAYNQAGSLGTADANTLQGYGNQMAANASQMQSDYNANFGNVQNATNTLYGMGTSSNQNYSTLQNQLGSQYGSVANSENNLNSAANSVLQSAFDPQNALYANNLSQLNDATNAAEYSRGIENTPYGASVQANADQQFQLNWNNQQLAREQSGLSSASGAYSSALGQGTNYAGAQSGLQTAENSNYANLTGAAEQQYTGYLNAQATNANLSAQGLANTYNSATGLANTAAGAYQNAGAEPYNANQTIYGNQQNAITGYNSDQTAYLSGNNQLMSNALGYNNYASGAQQVGWSQNMANQNQMMSNMNQLGSAFSNSGLGNSLGNGVSSLWNTWNGGTNAGAYNGGNVNSIGVSGGTDFGYGGN
jgi:hypothetical protein